MSNSSFSRRGSWPQRLAACWAAAAPLLLGTSIAAHADEKPAAEMAAPAVPAGAADPSATPAAAPLSETELAIASFQTFCGEWLEKLVLREEQNVAQIEWVTSDIGVRGVFIGYSRRGQCEAKSGTDAVPVGKLTYRQVTYEKKGPNVSAAELSAARPLDVAEVTEIFHYADGRWIY